jgi:sigma-B regulation protein RsbU (phosphoserine phosphatase)
MPLAYLLIGDIQGEDKLEISPTIKHLPFIQTLTNIIIVAIENKRLAKDNIKQEGVRKEMELASEMQNMLFPSVLPDNKQLQMAAHYQPHHQVGGDYYDLIKLNDHEVIICIADISGKGVSAALLMANFQANLRALVNHTNSLGEIVDDLNSQVMNNAKGEKFITLFIAKYNMVTHVLTYINAGHNPPLIINGNATNWLKTGCTGLGMFDELVKVREGILNVSPNSVMLCYTDGLIELENDMKEEYGMERLKNIVTEHIKGSMQELINSIKEDSSTYRQHQQYHDDIALLACRFF